MVRSSRLILIPLVLVSIASNCISQTNGEPQSATQSFSFETVSIRKNISGQGFELNYTPDGIRATNMPIQFVIAMAYKLRDPEVGMGQKPIPGAPTWIKSDAYDIQAKMSPSDFAAMQKLTEDQKTDRLRLMLQSMLIERFHLKVRKDIKPERCYALVVNKNGPKFKETLSHNSKSPDGDMFAQPGSIKAKDAPISGLIFALNAAVGCPVQDKTGLTKRYALTLQYSVDQSLGAYRNAPAPDQSAPQSESQDPPLFTAIQTQLGLKLIPAMVPTESIFIEHIDHPTAN